MSALAAFTSVKSSGFPWVDVRRDPVADALEVRQDLRAIGVVLEQRFGLSEIGAERRERDDVREAATSPRQPAER